MAVAASDLGELYQAKCDADCEEQIVYRLNRVAQPSPSPPSGDGHLVPARTPSARPGFSLGARRTLASLRVNSFRGHHAGTLVAAMGY